MLFVPRLSSVAKAASSIRMLPMVVFVVLCVIPPAVYAAEVPKSLVPLTIDLARSTRQTLKDGTQIDTEHQAYNQRAYQILRRNGVYHWARPAALENDFGLQLLAALGLELHSHDIAPLLEQFLLDIQVLTLTDAIYEYYLSAGEPPPYGERLEEIVNAVKKELAIRNQAQAMTHIIQGPDDGQSIRLQLLPDEYRFFITVRDEGDNTRSPFQTTLSADINETVSEDGRSLQRTALPAENPVQSLNEAELNAAGEKQFNALLGVWLDQNGHRWTIKQANASENPHELILTHYFPDGAALRWDGKYKANSITATRKAVHMHDTQEGLPMPVRQQIISSWQPALSIKLESRNRDDRIVLAGEYQTWHVTYDGGSYEVKRIHTQLIKPLSLAREATLLSIEFVQADAPFNGIDELESGDHYRIRLTFDRAPGTDSEPVSVENSETGEQIEQIALPTGNPDMYLTEPITYNTSRYEDAEPCPCALY